MYRHGKDIVPLVPPLMRRHKKLEQKGTPINLIKDHYMHNYVEMQKMESWISES